MPIDGLVVGDAKRSDVIKAAVTLRNSVSDFAI